MVSLGRGRKAKSRSFCGDTDCPIMALRSRPGVPAQLCPPRAWPRSLPALQRGFGGLMAPSRGAGAHGHLSTGIFFPGAFGEEPVPTSTPQLERGKRLRRCLGQGLCPNMKIPQERPCHPTPSLHLLPCSPPQDPLQGRGCPGVARAPHFEAFTMGVCFRAAN